MQGKDRGRVLSGRRAVYLSDKINLNLLARVARAKERKKNAYPTKKKIIALRNYLMNLDTVRIDNLEYREFEKFMWQLEKLREKERG